MLFLQLASTVSTTFDFSISKDEIIDSQNCLFPLNYLIFPSKFARLSHRTQQFCHFFCLYLCHIDTFVSKVLTKLMKKTLIAALTLLATVTFAQHNLVGVDNAAAMQNVGTTMQFMVFTEDPAGSVVAENQPFRLI